MRRRSATAGEGEHKIRGQTSDIRMVTERPLGWLQRLVRWQSLVVGTSSTDTPCAFANVQISSLMLAEGKTCSRFLEVAPGNMCPRRMCRESLILRPNSHAV